MSEGDVLQYASAEPRFVAYQPLHGRTQFAMISFAVWLFISLAAMVTMIVMIGQPAPNGGSGIYQMAMRPKPVIYISNISTMASFIWFVAFGMWAHRAYRNLRSFGLETRFTPRWAVISLFIPVLNLFRIYQVMVEIWQGSANSIEESNARQLLTGWWSSYLAITFGLLFVTLYKSITGYPDLDARTRWVIGQSIVYQALTFIPAALLFVILYRINRMQAARAVVPVNP